MSTPSVAFTGASADRRRLLVLAPPELGARIAAWSERERSPAGARDPSGARPHLTILDRPNPDGPRHDPYRLGERLAQLLDTAPFDAALLVAPRRRGPARALPGSVIRGRSGVTATVALLQADRPSDLDPWLTAVQNLSAPRQDSSSASVTVAAMGKRIYLEIAGDWLARMSEEGIPVHDLRADRTRREALCAAAAAGPSVLLYAGHGRARGWGGYQALRWNHVVAHPLKQAAGTVISVACQTLSRTRSLIPFGTRFVSSGRAGCYLGAVAPIPIEASRRLSDHLVDELVTGRHPDVASLLRAVTARVDPESAHVLGQFRIVGNPLQPLPSWT